MTRIHSLIFFQAEDGIRDDLVTGVQTCALPIRLTSRTKVRTSRYEKKPIVSHGSITAHAPRSSWIRNPLGKSTKHNARSNAPTTCVTAPNGKRSRTPIYTCRRASRRTTGLGNFIGAKWEPK